MEDNDSLFQWVAKAEFTQNIDYRSFPKCGDQIDSAFLITAFCELPSVEALHTIYGGHVGTDSDGFIWNWNHLGARMVPDDPRG